MINPFLKTPKGQHGRNIEIKNLRNSWSKYGGVKLGVEKTDGKWFCQVCREDQPEAIEPFLFAISDREYLRICSNCEHKKIQNEIIGYETLIIMCRKDNPHEIFKDF